MTDRRFYNAMCAVMGRSADYSEVCEPFCTNLPESLRYIGTLVGDFRADVYRGHVSLDDAFMHKSFYVEGKFYYTTIYEKGVTVLVSEESNVGNSVELASDKFAALFCDLGIMPSREMQNDFDTYNSLQTAICD